MNEKKRLEWQYALGTATVVYRLGGKDKDCELSCSTVQMLILLAMNGVETIKLSELASNIGVDIDKVKMAAAPLTADKRLQQQILLVVGAAKVRQAADSDLISANPDFTKNKKLVRASGHSACCAVARPWWSILWACRNILCLKWILMSHKRKTRQ
jgi:hypothetical protein